MNISSRLKKLELRTIPNENLCMCPDAIAYVATPYFTTCYRCGKKIDVMLWRTWNVLEPDQLSDQLLNDGCPFALARTDEIDCQVDVGRESK